MESSTFLRAAEVSLGKEEGQAEVAASDQPTSEVQAQAEVAAEPAPASTDSPAETVTEEVTEAAPPSSAPTYDVWNDLKGRTKGLIEDEQSFNALVDKSKEYETLLQSKEELEKNQFKPANEYIAKLNELTLAGASADQISAFTKLNSYGELKDLHPLDAKVLKMVLKDGFTEEMARKIVGREFDLSQFDEEDAEGKESADIMREKLRVDALKDVEILKEYKKELTVVHNPEKEAAEQARLQMVADTANYNQTVEQQASAIAKHFPDKFNYEFTIGDKKIAYEDSFEKDFIEKDLPRYINEYFKDSMDPINEQTISEAYGFAYAEYVKQNDAKRLERAYQKGHSSGVEETVNRYENRSGLPKSEDNQTVITNQDGMSNFTRKMVGLE